MQVKSDNSFLAILGRLRSATSISVFDKGVIVALPAAVLSDVDPGAGHHAHRGVLLGESPVGSFALLLRFIGVSVVVIIVVLCLLVVICLVK
jgi:hypothetical protein